MAGSVAGSREGMRELTLFWELNFLLLAQPGRPVDIWNAAERLASEISSETFWAPGEHGTLGTLYRRLQGELGSSTPRTMATC